MQWILLIGANVSEVSATLALKTSDGFSNIAPSVCRHRRRFCACAAVPGAQARDGAAGWGQGVAYQQLAAAGVRPVALAGCGFGEGLTLVQAGRLALVASGLALELGATH